MRRLTLIMALLAIALLSFVVVGAQGRPAEVATHIIVFNNGFNGNVPDFAQANGLSVTHEYQYALRGVAAVVPAGRLAALERNPNVAYVEENRFVSINAQTVPTGVDRAFATNNPNLDIDGQDDFRVDVDVAVIDTGIDWEHPDLNVVGGIDCSGISRRGGRISAVCSGNGDDDHYHGTHVAGTIGALDNDFGVVGIAPGARLWAVKVLNSQGSAYDANVIAGIDWVAANAGTIEVANMSLGGAGYSQAEEDAIYNAQALGVVFVVAAGNEADDARNHSPAAFPDVITVSALADFDGIPGGLGSPTCRTDEDDTLAAFSNYGPVVDIAAPGVCIYSTYPLEQGSYASISGTSMASPQVAGAAALLASVNNPNNAADVAAIRDALVNAGNYNWTDDSGDGILEPLLDVSSFNANLIANDGGGNPTPEPTPEPCNHPNPKKCN